MKNPADEYLKKLQEEPEFKRLAELKGIIDEKYKSLIIGLKTSEARYLEAKEYPKHFSNMSELQESFVTAKKKLYSQPEVQEYFRLERRLQEMINEDMNELKEAVSNKFSRDKSIKI